MCELENRTALITGAGAGIGAAVAVAYARAGATVMVTDIDADAAARVAAEITSAGGRAASAQLDVRNMDQAMEVAQQCANLSGGSINILVNNAGAIAPAMFDNLAEEDFSRIVDIHLHGSYRCSKAALPFIPDDGSGRIINVTSAAGLTGTIGQANYGAAKAGIIGLTKSLAKELAKRNITVNALAPLAATEMTKNIRENEKLAAKTLARIPMGRWANPDEIAATFVFFASSGAGYITGQVLPVDGGTVI